MFFDSLEKKSLWTSPNKAYNVKTDYDDLKKKKL